MSVNVTIDATATFTTTVVIGVFLDLRKRRSEQWRPTVRWDSDTERKLIDVWADILEEISTVHLPSQDTSSP